MTLPVCSLCEMPDSQWLLSYTEADPTDESTREALLTLGNGYFATRGAVPEASADGVHYPATYIAGVYNRLASEVHGHVREDESIVNVTNWLPVTFRPEGGSWFTPGGYEVEHRHEVLDMQHGILLRESFVRDPEQRRTRIQQERLISMNRFHVAALRTTITPLDWEGTIHVRSVLDGGVRNDNVAEFAELAKEHLSEPAKGRHGDTYWLACETVQSDVCVAQAARTLLHRDHRPALAASLPVEGPRSVGNELSFAVSPSVPATVDKTVTVFTSRDRAISEPLDATRDELADTPGFETLRDEHFLAWEHLWKRFHLSFQGDDGTVERRALNLHVFHLAQTLSKHTADLDVGVPARGLHGEGYRGHIFWDELFVFPILNLRVPELTRALLLYRYRRLPHARRLARETGATGALFPWQSGSDGQEETPRQFYNPRSKRWMADNSRRQYHVDHAVAYNIWLYYQVTGDIDFLAAYGAELLVEIARFWVSIAEHDPEDGRYHLRGVMGPDEFHDGYPDRPGEGLDDNAYVNIMAAWTLARVLEAHEVLGGHHTEDLWQRLGVTPGELEQWDRVSRRLHVPFLPGGLIGQFEGYAELEELDWDGYRARYGNIGRLDLILEAEDDTTNRYKASKQADVLMLFYLLSAEELGAVLERLGYDFDPASIPETVDYYRSRTTHGSTLSSVVYSWVMSRGNREGSWELLREALAADLSDTQGGTTREGIHLGAMAGTIDIFQRCYTGLETRADALRLHPCLPDDLKWLDFDLRYRGHWLHFQISHEQVLVRARPGAAAPIAVVVEGQRHMLGGGDRLVHRLAQKPGHSSFFS
ncbi:glycoside hydrolase family 65 protein [Actinocorallia aurantiaca]|uniref:Glycosyl hydrolase family 65 protein n=1 Tax=Actinocorallia aurantiaca TaxID=46204 RepID=A0ABP6GC42_9ACTN